MSLSLYTKVYAHLILIIIIKLFVLFALSYEQLIETDLIRGGGPNCNTPESSLQALVMKLCVANQLALLILDWIVIKSC